MAVQKIIIQENTALTAVQNTSTQDSNLIAANGQQQYAGYEYSNWIQSGAAWSGAYAQWTVPTASAPSGKCQLAHCDFDIWVGESNQPGGGNCPGPGCGLAQTGSDSGVYCVVGCFGFYNLWYNFYSGSQTNTNCLSINLGDTVLGAVMNYGRRGVPTNTYTLVMQDLTQSNGCTAQTQTMSMGLPYYGQFIGERPEKQGGGFVTLPNFGSFSFSHGTMQYLTSTYNIGSAGSNQYIMQYFTNQPACNSNVQPNIRNGNPNNGGFSETWLQSACT